MTTYLSSSEAAARIGIKHGTFCSYRRQGRTPAPDARIGKTEGWLPGTIDEWNKNRPGQGARTDLTGKK